MGGSHNRRRQGSSGVARFRAGLASISVAVAMPLALVIAQQGAAMGAESSNTTCASAGKVFIVDGTNDDPNNLHTEGVGARYPGYEVEHVSYPATIWPLGASSYGASSAAGREALHQGVVDYRARPGCAESPVVIVGYSQGAAIAGDELHAIAHDPDSPIAATDSLGRPIVSGELYADPRRAGDARGRGIELSLIGIIPGLVLRGPRKPGGYGDVPVLDVCLDGDPVCDMPDPAHDPVGAADALLGFFTKHFYYDEYMDDPGSAGAGPSPTGTVIVPRPMAFAMVLGVVGVHAFDDVASVYIPLPYPELGAVQPVVAFLARLGPQFPDLGHGATLPDLYTIRDSLQGNTVARARLVADLTGIGRYPSNSIAAATAAIATALESSGASAHTAGPESAPTSPSGVPTVGRSVVDDVRGAPAVASRSTPPTLLGEMVRRLHPPVPAPTRPSPVAPVGPVDPPAPAEPSSTPTADVTGLVVPDPAPAGVAS